MQTTFQTDPLLCLCSQLGVVCVVSIVCLVHLLHLLPQICWIVGEESPQLLFLLVGQSPGFGESGEILKHIFNTYRALLTLQFSHNFVLSFS